ncbi:dockerin type I domain-containing protein [Archangium lansingense]|uniref:Dockerin type I domain-containing protein n=1 Tax=Archangium lansingense TaxID=2995310 RepID=A0ABT4AN59_9BACT|nr:dockerin type I domain-containing protein [Archangium lansinium]MCY1083138.1 dockerin type I domain-containing protein [Archangium lansinium]
MNTQSVRSPRFAHVLVALLVTLSLQSREAAAEPFDEEHIIILLDRSGSMQATRSDGQSRFFEAIRRARIYVGKPKALPTEYSVWSFEGSASTQESGFGDAGSTTGVLNGLQVGNGVTPLAKAVCDAVDVLLNHKPGVNASKRLYLVSDGEENSTPLDSPCYGPSSVGTYPNLTMDSWQWKVRNMLKTGDPLREDNSDYALVFDVDVFDNYVSLRSGSSPVYEVSYEGKGLVTTASLLPASYLAFLRGVATDSGGTFTTVPDSGPAPIPGDTNQDNCVNATDFYHVLNNFGRPVPPASPTADLNRDGVVNYSDYSIVVNNQGAGCSSGPAHLR